MFEKSCFSNLNLSTSAHVLFELDMKSNAGYTLKLPRLVCNTHRRIL